MKVLTPALRRTHCDHTIEVFAWKQSKGIGTSRNMPSGTGLRPATGRRRTHVSFCSRFYMGDT